MVVLLSALLVSLPNMRLFENKKMSTVNEQVSIRRSLLSDLQATEDDLNMEEFLVFKDDDPEYVNKFGGEVHGTDNFTLDNMSKFFILVLMALTIGLLFVWFSPIDSARYIHCVYVCSNAEIF